MGHRWVTWIRWSMDSSLPTPPAVRVDGCGHPGRPRRLTEYQDVGPGGFPDTSAQNAKDASPGRSQSSSRTLTCLPMSTRRPVSGAWVTAMIVISGSTHSRTDRASAKSAGCSPPRN